MHTIRFRYLALYFLYQSCQTLKKVGKRVFAWHTTTVIQFCYPINGLSDVEIGHCTPQDTNYFVFGTAYRAEKTGTIGVLFCLRCVLSHGVRGYTF